MLSRKIILQMKTGIHLTETHPMQCILSPEYPLGKATAYSIYTLRSKLHPFGPGQCAHCLSFHWMAYSYVPAFDEEMEGYPVVISYHCAISV